MPSAAMKLMMCYTASTKRRPATGATGIQAAPTTYLTALKITPIDPLNEELILRLKIESPVRHRVCYTTTDQDIAMGDVLVYGGREYIVRGLGEWFDHGEWFYEIIVELPTNA